MCNKLPYIHRMITDAYGSPDKDTVEDIVDGMGQRIAHESASTAKHLDATSQAPLFANCLTELSALTFLGVFRDLVCV